MNLKIRLILMNFLEFAVWGAYLTCMGIYLGKAGMGEYISWFYAIQGIVSIFMPAIMGVISDKYIQPQKLLGYCHLIAGALMLCLFFIGAQNGWVETVDDSGQVHMIPGAITNPALFITIYTISVAFFMPTIALANTVAFAALKEGGYDTVKDFPPIRVFGTIGFIATMWFVNCSVWDNGSYSLTLGDSDFKFQFSYMQFLVSGILSVVLFLYSFTLPKCKIEPKPAASWSETFGLNAFKLFNTKKMAMFFIFSALLGMCLQVTNSYAGPFIESFRSNPALKDTFAANNATLLVSLSQIAEACCILLIPFFLKRFGIKVVMLIAMFAWVFRFGFFGLGNPAMPGVILFILSCLVYGVAFDFFNVSGAMFVDKECKDPKIKSSAQGLFMLMTNGIGATIGMIAAGKIIKLYCHYDSSNFLVENNPGDWQTAWFIFAGFALVVAVSFWVLFKYKHDPKSMGEIKH